MKENRGINWLVLFLVVTLAFVAGNSLVTAMASRVTVVIESDSGYNGETNVNLHFPRFFSFYTGGENQVYVYQRLENGSEQLSFVLEPEGMIIVGSDEEDRYFLVCAPAGLTEDEALEFHYRRFRASNWHVEWEGVDDLPGSVTIHCR